VGSRTVEKEAGFFESLGRLRETERPPYLLLTRSGLEGSALFRRLADGPPLYQTASLGDDLLLFRACWDLVGPSARVYLPATFAAVAGLREVDRLNICDRVDEAAHGYRYESHRGEIELAGSVRIDDYLLPSGALTVADAGRAILGSESFRVRTRRGRDLVVVLRTNAQVEVRALRAQGGLATPLEMEEAGLVVRVEDRAVLRLALHNRPGWNEHVFRLPGTGLADGTTALHLTGRYAAFYYWFYQ
jgi:hypothetical protein